MIGSPSGSSSTTRQGPEHDRALPLSHARGRVRGQARAGDWRHARHRRGGGPPLPAFWRSRVRLSAPRVPRPARRAPPDPVEGVVFIAADIGTAAGADAIVNRLTADWG